MIQHLPTARSTGPDRESADPQVLAASLEEHFGAPVELIETHMSWVVLTPDRAYKLKRPVAFDFADLTDRRIRAGACRHELHLNAELAPGVELAVRSVVERADGSYTLTRDGDTRAIDHVIEMRRFDEGATMRSLLKRGALTDAQVRAAGARLARFHLHAGRAIRAVDHRGRADENITALVEAAGDRLDARELAGARRFADAFATGWADVLAAREAGGNIVDGHGDVRTDHVLFEDGHVLIVDRLDIDRLRDVDVADDLAFLAMDLEAHGGAFYVAPLLEGYAAGGGVGIPGALLSYYAACRALVRAKVALLPGAAGNALEARHLLGLARTFAWRARGPLLLLVTGPPASGKSTLAAGLSRISGVPVLSSDEIRLEHAGLGFDPEDRARVYAELARRAAGSPSVIVDATFGEPDLQEAFFSRLAPDDDRTVIALECTAPDTVRIVRAEVRQQGDHAGSSKAGPEVARVLGERFTPVPAARVDDRHAIDTTLTAPEQLDEVERRLDARLAALGAH